MRDSSTSSHTTSHTRVIDRTRAARLRRIAVALDGTPFAEAALPAATALGRAFNAEVLLVRAHTRQNDHVQPRLGLRRHARETLGRAGLYLARIEQDLLARGIRATSTTPVGNPADAVASVAARDCDLVVIAAHAGGLKSSSRVSVARELAVRCEAPLLIISPTSQGVLAPTGDALTLMLALDGARGDDTALALVASLAGAFAGRVIALSATHEAPWRREPVVEHPLEKREQVEARAAVRLEQVRAELTQRGVTTWTAILEGDLLSEIARMPRVEHEVFVLGVHGTLARREAIVDSAMELLKNTDAAILLVPQEPLLTLCTGGGAETKARGGTV